VAGVLVAPLVAEVRLPHIFDDHMVLQRDMELPVWGWADAGEEVTVTLNKNSATAKADKDGRWRVTLPAMTAGGPHTLTVKGTNTLERTDILIGEVWLCSGQSNMEMGVGVALNGEEEIAAASYPRIRLFEVGRAAVGEPADDVDATWRVCSPETIGAGSWGGFSAAGYYFGRELYRRLDVPIGLIDSSWGGTAIEPWTPPCGFAGVPSLQQMVELIKQRDEDYRTKELPAKLKEIEEWRTATEAALAAGESVPAAPAWPRHPLASEREPTGLYNGMIHPLAPFAIRGAIWYQGEANVIPNDGMTYCAKMKALIGGWREVWGEGDFPFYFVQLAPFNYSQYWPDIGLEQLPAVWEAQVAALSIPNTGIAATIDIGDGRDIHPRNKQEVGRRLALWALARTYGNDQLVCSGPIFRKMTVTDGRVRIEFDHTGGGLVLRDGSQPTGFEIAGEDGKYTPAEARIEGETVVVWHDGLAEPVAVRYAWNMLPEPIPNLVNRAGLPALPFRTER
jgi:sialate O-acetylesterase